MTQFGQLNYSTLGLYLVATVGKKVVATIWTQKQKNELSVKNMPKSILLILIVLSIFLNTAASSSAAPDIGIGGDESDSHTHLGFEGIPQDAKGITIKTDFTVEGQLSQNCAVNGVFAREGTHPGQHICKVGNFIAGRQVCCGKQVDHEGNC